MLKHTHIFILVILIVCTSRAKGDTSQSCSSFFHPAIGHRSIDYWKVKHLAGHMPAHWTEGLIETVVVHVAKKFYKKASKCLLGGPNHLLTGPYANAVFREKLRLLLQYKRELESLQSHDESWTLATAPLSEADKEIAKSQMHSKAADLWGTYVKSLTGNFKTVKTKMQGVCFDLESVSEETKSNLGILDQVSTLSLKKAVIEEMCSPENRQHLEHLDNQCLEEDSQCELLSLYDAIQSCQEFQNSESTEADLDIATLEDISSEFEAFQLKSATAALHCHSYVTDIQTLWDDLQQAPEVLSSGEVSSKCQTINNLVGSPEAVSISPSSVEEAQFGIKLRYLYGDWDPISDFNNTDLYYGPPNAGILARHSVNCLDDPIVGRFPPQYFAFTEAVTSVDALSQLTNKLIMAKNQFLTIQNNLESLLPEAMSPAISIFEEHIGAAILKFYSITATHMEWVVEMAERVINSKDLLKQGVIVLNKLITHGFQENPEIKNEVIRRLKNNTESVLDQYKSFVQLINEASFNKLEERLEQVSELMLEENFDSVILDLNQWVGELESTLTASFEEQEPLYQAAVKLHFIFGGCEAQQQVTDFFGDNAATQYFLSTTLTPEQCEELRNFSGGNQ